MEKIDRTRMNPDKHGSLPKKEIRNAKGATKHVNNPAERVYGYSRPIPEIPPSPPLF
jgi:hypothetical protein